MRMFLGGVLFALMAAMPASAANQADQWTSPKEVSKAAHEFSKAAQGLQKSIQAVEESSPLGKQMQRISESAEKLHDSVDKGASYEDALRDHRKLVKDYEAFQASLKGAHEIHHDEAVVKDVKKVKDAFDRLQSNITGKKS
jgi:hypothetical protein